MASSFSPLKFLFLFLFLLSFPFSNARNHHGENSHDVSSSTGGILAKKRAEKLIKSFNLSPKGPVSIRHADTSISESEEAPGIVEKQFKFPSLLETGPSIRKLGHHAGYYKLSHSKAARMFYFFFESRKSKRDPVVIWLTGGPGCSSSLALFYEMGPFHITKNLSLVWNEYGWDQASNLLFVDQPIGTGFSYTTNDEDYVSDEEGVSNDLYDFLQAFFRHHPEFVKNDFYITGESYAGHYIPALAGRIHKGNKANEGIHINFKGMAIGDGLTNSAIQFAADPDYALKMSLINQSDYYNIEKLVPNCVKSAKACESGGGNTTCVSSFEACGSILDEILSIAGNINYYDIRKKCEGPLCYDLSAIEIFLNEKSVKEALGVGNITFVSCSTDVYDRMEGDWMKNLAVGIPELLEDGIRVLLYEGEYDLICNWLGNYRWVNALNWSGQKDFLAAPMVPFVVDRKEAGKLKTHGPLSFLKVHNAGHMVPMDQPKNSLQMLKRWIKGKLAVQHSERTAPNPK
ncbi:hypothetical protein SLE2022_285980 [Rubroshorea leprosula]